MNFIKAGCPYFDTRVFINRIIQNARRKTIYLGLLLQNRNSFIKGVGWWTPSSTSFSAWGVRDKNQVNLQNYILSQQNLSFIFQEIYLLSTWIFHLNQFLPINKYIQAHKKLLLQGCHQAMTNPWNLIKWRKFWSSEK